MTKKKSESEKERQIGIAKKLHTFKQVLDHLSKQKSMDSSKKK